MSLATVDPAVSLPRITRLVAIIERRRWFIILFWAALLAVGAALGPQLLSSTTLSFSAPHGSQAAIAQAKLAEFFPVEASYNPIIAVLERVNGSTILGDDVRAFSAALNATLFSLPKADQFLSPTSLQDYYTYADRGLLILGDQLVKEQWALALIMVDSSQLDAQSKLFTKHVMRAVDKLRAEHWPDREVEVTLTGSLVFGVDIMASAEHDLLIMDGVAFPIALCILALVLSAFRLLIIPVLNMATSVLVAFTVMLPVTHVMDVISFAPSVMMSGCIAMSIDYSLFLLTRFREELLKGNDVRTAVIFMLWSAGHTIIVSGSTIVMCFLGLMFFPTPMLSTVGLGAGVAISMTMLVNLSLTPALLLTFRSFFGNCTRPFPWAKRAKSADTYDAEAPLLVQSTDASSLTHDVTLANRRSCWFRLAVLTTRFPVTIIVVVTLLAAGMAYRAVNFQRTLSILSFTPIHSSATKAYLNMDREFGTGNLFYYNLIATAPPGVNVLSPEYFSTVNDVLRSYVESLPGDAVATGLTQLTFGVVDSCLGLGYCSPPQEPCRVACELLAETVNMAQNVSYALVRLPIDPFQPAGVKWLHRARTALAAAAVNNPGYNFYLANQAALQIDASGEVYHVFPTAVAITVSFVVVLVGCAFRSLVIPLRSVVSITTTLAFVYGSAVFVFQYGIFDFLDFYGLRGQGALNWIAPIFSFSVLVGLSLDYDVFLLSRVVEFREAGFDNRDAIVLGVTQTGSIITAAGGIMAIAFMGLLFSGEPVLNQMGFFLVLSVLLDTLLIRTILVPAYMAVLGRWNWWPSGRMPPVTRSLHISGHRRRLSGGTMPAASWDTTAAARS